MTTAAQLLFYEDRQKLLRMQAQINKSVSAAASTDTANEVKVGEFEPAAEVCTKAGKNPRLMKSCSAKSTSAQEKTLAESQAKKCNLLIPG